MISNAVGYMTNICYCCLEILATRILVGLINERLLQLGEIPFYKREGLQVP